MTEQLKAKKNILAQGKINFLPSTSNQIVPKVSAKTMPNKKIVYLSCIKLLPRYPDFLSSKISRNKRVPIGVVFLIK